MRFLRALRAALSSLLPGGAARARAADHRQSLPNDPEGRMPVLDHLRELRNRIVKVLVIIGVGAVVGWLLYNRILDVLKAPYCDLPYDQRFPGIKAQNCDLVFTEPLGGLTTRLKVSVIAGAVLTAPLWL
ncbi:MAG: Sec-independent protein translocase, TatC subunit, partial [Pseudonocardiales bacterium]|nr:Sec-independent protein translocase, TatC subunit [Pseudonocardiales bacterium]